MMSNDQNSFQFKNPMQCMLEKCDLGVWRDGTFCLKHTKEAGMCKEKDCRRTSTTSRTLGPYFCVQHGGGYECGVCGKRSRQMFCYEHCPPKSKRCKVTACYSYTNTGSLHCKKHLFSPAMCSEKMCASTIVKQGRCEKHYRRCVEEGCPNIGYAGKKGYCGRHSPRKLCKDDKCTNKAIKSAAIGLLYCLKHGGGNKCFYPACFKLSERNFCKSKFCPRFFENSEKFEDSGLYWKETIETISQNAPKESVATKATAKPGVYYLQKESTKVAHV